jgi:hypothetical protein
MKEPHPSVKTIFTVRESCSGEKGFCRYRILSSIAFSPASVSEYPETSRTRQDRSAMPLRYLQSFVPVPQYRWLA